MSGLLISSAGGITLLSHHLIAAIAGLLAWKESVPLEKKRWANRRWGWATPKLAALGGAWLGGAGLTMALGLAVLSGALVGSLGRLVDASDLGNRLPLALLLLLASGWSGFRAPFGGGNDGWI